METTTNHLLAALSGKDIFTLTFLLVGSLLAIVWRNFLIVFLHKAREMMVSRDWRTFDAENAHSGTRLYLFLSIVSLTSVSVLIYQVIGYVEESRVSILLIVAALAALHFLRFFLTKMLEIIFSLPGAFIIWAESYSWIHFIIGVLLFPLAVIMTYAPETAFSVCINLVLVLFLMGELLLIYRLVVVFYNGLGSLYYLFLYLCTLEILPLLIVFKLLF